MAKNVEQQLGVFLALLAMVATITSNITACGTAGPDCLHVPGGYAPSMDTKTLISNLIASPHQCCKLEEDEFRSVVASAGVADVSVCGCGSFCVPCRVAGSYILGVHDMCVLNGEVQGYFSLDDTSCRMLYLNRLGTWRNIKPVRGGPPSLLRGTQNLKEE
ncbi:hypothetical protein R1flu_011910 [Riccia fluitans]|uniref:Uncharacterized protein n=1 Tax=Riccia fluitans TaxID=41844 RepID=A0ABD1Z938_9MARC